MGRDVQRYPHPDEMAPEQLSRLADRIVRSIAEAVGDDSDDPFGQIVRQAVSTFVTSGGDVAEAVGTVARQMERVGEQQARRGGDADDLATAFRAALVAAQQGLSPVVGDLVDQDTLLRLRHDLVQYLNQLHQRAHAALTRTARLLAMTPTQRRCHLAALAFGDHGSADLESLALFEGLDPASPMVPVISVSTAVPETMRAHPSTVAGSSPLEILVPESWASENLHRHVVGQVVVGPATTLPDAARAVALTRAGAELLRDGTASRAQRIVACSDLLGRLVVTTNPLIGGLAVAKHLGPLDQMPPARKVALGELLLATLGDTRPVNHVAVEMGIPSQTAHSRMRAVREIFGDALNDVEQRIELLFALHTALPRWRREAA